MESDDDVTTGEHIERLLCDVFRGNKLLEKFLSARYTIRFLLYAAGPRSGHRGSARHAVAATPFMAKFIASFLH